ncbi:uncharacterized protein LOC115919849 [Strongylocentrotus purpuratus]|nr:uncharacterized protein LOC115919849 [Strongylocentrotus purpuratus]
MDHCDDSHVVVSQTDTVLDVTDTPMDHCDDSHVVVSQTDTVLDVTDTPMDHCDDSHVVVSQTDTVLDVTDTPMDHCDDSHVVVSQTDTVLDVTDTPMDHCDDSHVVVSQTDTVLDVTDNPTDHCDDSHVVVSQTDTGEEAPDTPLSQWPVDQSPNPDNNGGSCPNLDETILYGQTDDTTATPLGFTLTFDNVNQRTRTSFHSSEGKANRQFNLVQSYGEIDRVPCFHLSDEPPSLEQLSSICEDVFLPSTKDTEMLRYEYEVMIARILCNHIPCFRDMSITEHIPHPYLAETKKKSVMVPLGVLEKDESKVSDMIDVLDYLHRYVPGDKSPIPVVLYGDQLSCERVRDAMGARINEDTPWDRLSGLQPAIQEWHKRLLMLTVPFQFNSHLFLLLNG